MNRSPMCTILAFLALLCSSAVDAQLFRAYLSSTGSDANACTLAAPCRLLPAALAAVANGGEIWMLDSANYNTGTVQITQSVTILAIPGEIGSVLAQGESYAISIASAGVDVKLRNLAIVNNASNPGGQGINMSNGNSLTVEGCLIANIPGTGIDVGAAAKVSVSDSVIRNSAFGIFATGGASVDISNVNFSGMTATAVEGRGTVAGTTTRITVSNSHFTHNNVGVSAYAQEIAAVRITVTRSSITLGQYGVGSQSGAPGSVASVSVSNSLLAGLTGYAFTQSGSGAVTESFGNNTLRNNTTNVSGTLTTLPPM